MIDDERRLREQAPPDQVVDYGVISKQHAASVCSRQAMCLLLVCLALCQASAGHNMPATCPEYVWLGYRSTHWRCPAFPRLA
jgi:hypothetical protein